MSNYQIEVKNLNKSFYSFSEDQKMVEYQPNKSGNTESKEPKVQKMVVLSPQPLNISSITSFTSEGSIAWNPIDIKIPLSITGYHSKAKALLSLQNLVMQKDQTIQNLKRIIESFEISADQPKLETVIEDHMKSLEEKNSEIVSLKQLNIDISNINKTLLNEMTQKDELILTLNVQLKELEQEKENEFKKLKIKNSELHQEIERCQQDFDDIVEEKIKRAEENSYLISKLESSEKIRIDLQRELYASENKENNNFNTLNLLEETKKSLEHYKRQLKLRDSEIAKINESKAKNGIIENAGSTTNPFAREMKLKV